MSFEQSKFKNISLGICGHAYPNATKNAAFFSGFWKEVGEIEGLLQGRAVGFYFPQRIPRPDFIEELVRLEDPAVSLEIQSKLQSLNHAADRALAKTFNEDHAKSVLMPLMSVLTRYGLAQRIRDFPEAKVTSIVSLEYECQRQILLQIEAADSGNIVDFDAFKVLLKKCQDFGSSGIIFAQTLISRMIVFSCRFEPGKSVAKKYSTEVISSLPLWLEFRPQNNSEALRWSTILRGLAMTPGLKQESIEDLMWRALRASEIISAETFPWSILRSELQATLWQSISKMHAFKEDDDRSVNALLMMRSLDRFDSTASSEIGIGLYKIKQWRSAISHFERAVELGPPAVAMNLYFKGLCEKNLGYTSVALHSFKNSAMADDLTPSPLIELIKIYQSSGEFEAARQVALSISNNHNLLGQLDSIEKYLISEVLE